MAAFLGLSRRQLIAICVSIATGLSSAPLPVALGQNSPSLENIYRTMVEAQAEQDRQEALRRQAAAGTTRVEPVPRSAPFSGQPVSPTQPSAYAPKSNPGVTVIRQTETAQANWFQTSIATVRDNVNRLIPELQRYAVSVPAAREVIGDVYQVSAEANSLYNRAATGEPIPSLLTSYQQLDVRWRDVSYRLRSNGSLDSRVSPLVDAIDEAIRQNDRQLGITPPIDRVRLRDLMIVTLTYMDAMFDDIRLAPNAFGQADTLLRDGRILRERLRQESYKIDRADYNDVIASYTEFVRQWRGYGMRLYQLNDTHINQRLDSIRRQGDEVYASLRIPAASDRGQIQFAGQRMTAALVALQQELNRWGTNRLPADQLRFADTVRVLVDRSQRLEAEITRSGASATSGALFTEMDNLWTTGLRSMRAVDPRSGLQLSLVQVDTLFGELRDLLNAGSWQGQTQILGVLASLEVASDDFNNDVQRYKRYLNPVAYRDAFSQASDGLFDTARDLHRAMEDRGGLGEAKRLTQRLVEQWQQLTPLLNEVTQRGLSQSRAEPLYEGYRQMQPLVAQAASLLLN